MFWIGLLIGIAIGAGGLLALSLAVAAGRADSVEIIYPDED